MSGHNVNIYFNDHNYQQIHHLIAQRQLSQFVNRLVTRELATQKQARVNRLRADYLSLAQDRSAQAEQQLLDGTIEDALAYDY